MSDAGTNLNSGANETGDEEHAGKEADGLKAALMDERRKRQTAETQAAEFRGQVEGLTAAPAQIPQQTERDMTPAELRRAVEDQRITEDEATSIQQNQAQRQANQRIDDRVNAAVAAQEQTRQVTSDLQRYRLAMPDLNDRESAAFAKAAAEMGHLVKLGYPSTTMTETVALRSAFGPIEDLEAASKAKGQRDTHQETGGSGGDEGGTDDAAPKDMTKGQRAFYQDQINQGVLADWAAVKVELAYKPQHGSRARKAA